MEDLMNGSHHGPITHFPTHFEVNQQPSGPYHSSSSTGRSIVQQRRTLSNTFHLNVWNISTDTMMISSSTISTIPVSMLLGVACTISVIVGVDGFSVVPHPSFGLKADQRAQTTTHSQTTSTLTVAFLFSAARDIPHYDLDKLDLYLDLGTDGGRYNDEDDDFIFNDDNEFIQEIRSKTFPIDNDTDLGRPMYRTDGNANDQATATGENDDCQEPYFDLATGKALCWGVNSCKNVVPVNETKETKAAATKKQQLTIINLMRKGGNANEHIVYQAMNSHEGPHHHYSTPRLMTQEEADDCVDPYVDMATGDELCWP
jgi:hypothetical protein